MPNSYYDHTTYPATSSTLASSPMRSELDSVEAGFDKLPTLTGNASKIVAVNAGETALESVATTGSGSVVRATSPTLVTPVLGAATATSINKVAITAPATGATLILAEGSTLATAGAFAATFTFTAPTTVTFPPSGTLLTSTGSVANLLGGAAGRIAYQTALDTTGFVAAGTSGQALLSGGTGAPTWTTGTLALAGNFATVGAFAATMTFTGVTGVTFPTTGALATLAGIEILTNKTINIANNTLTGVAASGANTDITSTSAIGNIGASSNLKAVLATNGTTAAFTADDVTVGTALSGTYRKLASYSQTLNIGTTGAGGMDTGTAPTSGFVAIYAIAQAGGTTSILGVNATTSSGSIYSGANMPSGYTFSALIGIWPTNATPQLLAGCVFDRKYSYQVFKTILSSVTLTTSYASQSISSAVPVTARGADYQWADANGTSYFYIAADSVGTAAKGGHFGSDASLRSQPNGMNSSRVSGGADDVPFITAQTAWIQGLGNVGGTSLYVKAYSF